LVVFQVFFWGVLPFPDSRRQLYWKFRSRTGSDAVGNSPAYQKESPAEAGLS
jgi:hypothetical protein